MEAGDNPWERELVDAFEAGIRAAWEKVSSHPSARDPYLFRVQFSGTWPGYFTANLLGPHLLGEVARARARSGRVPLELATETARWSTYWDERFSAHHELDEANRLVREHAEAEAEARDREAADDELEGDEEEEDEPFHESGLPAGEARFLACAAESLARLDRAGLFGEPASRSLVLEASSADRSVEHRIWWVRRSNSSELTKGFERSLKSAEQLERLRHSARADLDNDVWGNADSLRSGERLSDADATIRLVTAWCMGEIHALDPVGEARLLETVNDRDRRVAAAAAAACLARRIGRAPDQLARLLHDALGDGDRELRSSVVWMLAATRPIPLIPAERCVELALSGDAALRDGAILALLCHPRVPSAAVEARVRELAESADEPLAALAVGIAAAGEGHGGPHLERLRAAAYGSLGEISRQAPWILAQLARHSAAALDVYLGLAASGKRPGSDGDVASVTDRRAGAAEWVAARIFDARAIAELGDLDRVAQRLGAPADEASVRATALLLGSPNVSVRRAAAHNLARSLHDPSSAREALANALLDTDGSVQSWAGKALARVSVPSPPQRRWWDRLRRH